MKKQLLVLLAVLTTIQVSTAQDRIAPTGKNHATSIQSTLRVSAPSTRAVIWSDDFSNPANWVISNQTGNSDNWVVGVDTPSGTYWIPTILSTTAANGFAMFDSDNLCSGNQIADLTTANSFSTLGYNLVSLQFQQQYRRFFDSTMVLVSIDNSNWTPFTVNEGFVNNQFTPTNPEVVNIDISSVAANQPTVWLRFEFYSPTGFPGAGTNAGCAYAWMIDDVVVSDDCIPPAVMASALIACNGETVTLSVDSVLGQTYTWETSTDNATWTLIPGASGPSTVVTFTGAAYYRVIADCGGSSAPSTSIQVVANPTTPLCYCIPFSFTCNGLSYTSNVNITGTTLNFTSDCDTNEFAGFSNYTFVNPAVSTATLAAGTAYTFNVTTTDVDVISVWIDYNQNGEFEASEWNQVTTTSTAGVPSSVTFTIPATALNGMTGMRVRSRLATFANGAGDACLSMGSGETEDFMVTITGGVGISENVFSNATVKPTVTSDVVSIDLGTTNFTNARLFVSDVRGQAVVNNQPVNQQKFDVSLGSYEPGIYMVRVYTNNASFVQKVTLVK